MSNEPKAFTYSRWRHGGWYVIEIRWPNGGCGCVSNNYADKKWRIACDPRPFEARPTFKTREDAARAEWHFTEALKVDREDREAQQSLAELEQARDARG